MKELKQMIMEVLKKREELAEINRSRQDYRWTALLGALVVGFAVGIVLLNHWSGLVIGLMVLGVIFFVGGLVGEQRLDTKRKKYLRHMEEDTEEDK